MGPVGVRPRRAALADWVPLCARVILALRWVANAAAPGDHGASSGLETALCLDGAAPECGGGSPDDPVLHLLQRRACAGGAGRGCALALGRLDRGLTASAEVAAAHPPVPEEGGAQRRLQSQPPPCEALREGPPAPGPAGAASLTRPARVFAEGGADYGTTRPGFEFPRLDARMHDGDEVKLVTVHGTWLAALNGTHPAFAGIVTLRGGRWNKQCTVSESGTMSCTANSSGPRENVRVIEAYPGHVALRTASGKVCQDMPEGVTCTTDMNDTQVENGGWHAFEVVQLEQHGEVALKGDRLGRYCAVQDNGELSCETESVNAAATFHFIRYGSMPGATLVQTKNSSLATTFVVTRADLNSSAVALRCKEAGLYLTVDGGSGELKCASQEPVDFDYQRVAWWEPSQGSLLWPATKKYLQAWVSSTEVRVDSSTGEGWSLLTVVLSAGYEWVRPLIRGVNLGNWFVLEKWMDEELFQNASGKAFADSCQALDEYGLMASLGPKAAQERMERHWGTWITEEDVAWIAGHGLNAVRVPVGYWMVFPTPPFVPGQFKYLERLFRWCEAHGVAVLLDFHGLKGSQQGADTSGNCGACMQASCPGETWVRFLEEGNLATNLAVIANLTGHFSSSPVYLGFEMANENAAEAYGKDLSNDTMDFYQKAYDIIRGHSPHALVLIYETFQPSTYPFPNFEDVMTDTHIYYWRFGHAHRNNVVNMENARSILPSDSHWPVLVGEWSLSATGTDGGGPSQLGASEDTVDDQESFARAQLQVYEQRTQGWFYWSYKTAYGNSLWNYRDQCEQGNLPGCSDKFALGTADWWGAPNCTYAYLEGAC